MFDLNFEDLTYYSSPCDNYPSAPTLTSGSFADQTLYIDATSGYPLTLPVVLPQVTGSCAATISTYYIDQTTLLTESAFQRIISLDQTNSELTFQQPSSNFRAGTYPIKVLAFVPQRSAFVTDVFNFNVHIATGWVAPPCKSTTVSGLQIYTKSIET